MSTVCPHCQNRIGFVFGTCIECGFNTFDKSFRKIELWYDDLDLIPDDLLQRLMARHATRSYRPPVKEEATSPC